MSNQFIGVSPPPLGQALDHPKVDLKKDLKETSSGQYKNDFEKALKEKLATKEKSEASPPQKNEVRAIKLKKDKSEQKVGRDREEKESSGGIKKRMNEKVDDQMISMLMASNESEIEIPESKTDLAEIEENQLEKIASASAPMAFPSLDLGPVAETEVKGDALAQGLAVEDTIAKSVADLNQTEDLMNAGDKVAPQSLSSELMQKLQDLQSEVGMAKPGMSLATDIEGQQNLASEVQQIRDSFAPLDTDPEQESGEEIYIRPPIFPESPMMKAMSSAQSSAEGIAVGESVTEPMEQMRMAQAQILSEKSNTANVLTREISQQPGASLAMVPAVSDEVKPSFISDFDLEKDLHDEVGFKSSTALKAAESSDQPVSLKAQEFQKSVYEQLQKMDQPAQQKAVHSQPMQGFDSEVRQGEVKHEDMSWSSHATHHAGQAHSEFRSNAAGSSFGSTFAGSDSRQALLLEQNHEKNIQQVMQQAQYLVKKGGGEMKVSMSPDGLAEVQLKVMLQDGKVNIEMSTQDKTVKKLMENSLTELKSGLAAQNLNLEHVKISSVNATNTDNSAQFQSNWNQSGGEHQQREYWNQFQENLNQKQNSSRRSNYSASSGSAAISKSVDNSVVVTPRTYGGTKGSQINWVA